MPMYEFRCSNCGKEFEELVLSRTARVACPGCKSQDVARLMSVCSFKSPGSDTGTAASSGKSCAGCRSKNCGTCG